MAKSTGPKVSFTMHGSTFSFTTAALAGFPEAPGMLNDLLARGKVSPANASHYVVLAARLRRLGRLNMPEAIVRRVEKTAANAFWRWAAESYGGRVRPVLEALKSDDVRQGIRWLRRGSLVPPLPGKVLRWRLLPVPTKPGEAPQPRQTIAEEPCSVWTLHVPKRASTPVHEDPCPDCSIVKLTLEQVEVIATAFADAWGHRDLSAVPAECFLFGTPPIDGKIESQLAPTARVVAVAPDGALSAALDQLGASVSRESLAFIDRAREDRTAAVVIDFRAVLVDQIDAVLTAVREAAVRWLGDHAVVVPVVAAPLPTNNLPLPGEATTVYGTPAEFEAVAAPAAAPAPTLAPPPALPPELPSLEAFAATVLGEEPPARTRRPAWSVKRRRSIRWARARARRWTTTCASVSPTQFTDWAAINAAVRTRLVQCSVHKQAHSVTMEQAPCGPGAWVEIPQ